MNNEIKYSVNPDDSEYMLRSQEMKLEAGLLGTIFGSTARAAASIAWVIIFLLVCSGIAILFFNTSVTPVEYWKIISPIITLALGYLFGKRDK